MSKEHTDLQCPHCNAKLDRVAMPQGSGWEGQCHWVCFNNDCSYYREGYDWMWEKYRMKASYRYRLKNPETGTTSPLPVWSDDAVRDFIVEDEPETP